MIPARRIKSVMKVIIAGEIPFIDEIGRLCRHTAHDTAIFLVEDFLGAIEAGYALETLSLIHISEPTRPY